MKKLTYTDGTVKGPFSSVEAIDGGFLADSVRYIGAAATAVVSDWDEQVDGPVLKPQQLEFIKESRRKLFKTLRDEEVNEPIDGIDVSSIEAREDVRGALDNWATLGNPSSIRWIARDGGVVVKTRPQLQSVHDTYITRKLATYDKYAQLLELLETAPDPRTVEWS